jgi:hypothetical protein
MSEVTTATVQSDEFHEPITLPGVFVNYIAETEANDPESADLGCRELALALQSAPRRRSGRGYSVSVALCYQSLQVVSEYAMAMAETGGMDYEASWTQAGRTVLERARVAMAEWD